MGKPQESSARSGGSEGWVGENQRTAGLFQRPRGPSAPACDRFICALLGAEPWALHVVRAHLPIVKLFKILLSKQNKATPQRGRHTPNLGHLGHQALQPVHSDVPHNDAIPAEPGMVWKVLMVLCAEPASPGQCSPPALVSSTEFSAGLSFLHQDNVFFAAGAREDRWVPVLKYFTFSQEEKPSLQVTQPP